MVGGVFWGGVCGRGPCHQALTEHSEVHSKIEETKEELETMKNRIENQGSDEANLKQKIEKKKAELERGKKSLKRYQNVR